MTGFETNIRSVERAVRQVIGQEFAATAFLDKEGVVIRIVRVSDNHTVKHIIPWHELAMWAAPMGHHIVKKLMRKL